MKIKDSIRLVVMFSLLLVSIIPVSIVSAQGVTTVHLNGEASGFLPPPYYIPDDIIADVNVIGSPSSLEGSGVVHSTTTLTLVYSITGSINGDMLHLSGTVDQSNAYCFIGSSVEIVANVETGAFTYTLVPNCGPFTGVPLPLSGSSNIVITGG